MVDFCSGFFLAIVFFTGLLELASFFLARTFLIAATFFSAAVLDVVVLLLVVEVVLVCFFADTDLEGEAGFFFSILGLEVSSVIGVYE